MPVSTTATLAAAAAPAATAAAAGDLLQQRLISLVGIFVFMVIAWLFSNNKKVIQWRVLVWGLVLQFGLFALVFGVPVLHFQPIGFIHAFFDGLNGAVQNLIDYNNKGAGFVFGKLADPGGPAGLVFAFYILPSVIFLSSLITVLYYLGIMQKVVYACAWVMQKFMGTSGAETLSTAANLFMGQTEAPLIVRPYVARMTQSELFVIMAGGMANTTVSIVVVFVAMMSWRIPNIASHLLVCTLMSAPATFVICKLMVPEVAEPETRGTLHIHQEETPDANVLEAAARGASDGLSLALNIAAMLIAFIAIIALINGILGWAGDRVHFGSWGANLVPSALYTNGKPQFSLEAFFSWIFAPLAYLMGISGHECGTIGAFLGQRLVANEFVAYPNMAAHAVASTLSDRALILGTYALSGFANFSSIAIQIGGLGTIAPNKRSEVAKLGLRAVIGGSLASFMTAAIAGFLL